MKVKTHYISSFSNNKKEKNSKERNVDVNKLHCNIACITNCKFVLFIFIIYVYITWTFSSLTHYYTS